MEATACIMLLSVLLWIGLVRENERRKRELAEDLHKIFLGTIRPDPTPPKEIVFRAIYLNVKERNPAAVFAFLQARVRAGVLARRKDPYGRQFADFYVLTTEGIRLLRQTKE